MGRFYGHFRVFLRAVDWVAMLRFMQLSAKMYEEVRKEFLSL